LSISPHIGVVILNWNGTGDTIECLRSIALAGTDRVKVAVTVVDNGSEHDPTAEIKSAYPTVTVIRLERNVGFAAGCNVGINRAIAEGSDYILLLNNDALVCDGLFEILLQTLASVAKVGIVGPLIYEGDRHAIDFAGAEINFALGRFRHTQTRPAKTAPRETDYVSGACMLFSRELIEGVGLLDEKLFAYFEDVDFCLRARNAGFRLLCVPAASAIHKGSASTRRTLTTGTTSPLKHYLIARNRTIVVRRYASAASKWFYQIVSTLARVAFYTAGFLIRGRWSKLYWFWRGTIDGLFGRQVMPVDLIK
jgi:GT2 family glycosyltransferase